MWRGFLARGRFTADKFERSLSTTTKVVVGIQWATTTTVVVGIERVTTTTVVVGIKWVKSCQKCPAHIVMCYNAKTGVTETLLTIIFEPKTARFTSARHVLSYAITTTRAQIEIKCCFFLPDTLAVRLLSYYFAFSFCKLQLSNLQIYFKAYV